MSAKSYDVSGGSHRISALLGQSVDLVECLEEDICKLVVDLFKRPGEGLQVLHPLEVGDDNTACVCENVGNNYLALGVEYLIRLVACRTVCALDDVFRLYPVGVVGSDLTFERCGDKEVAISVTPSAL